KRGVHERVGTAVHEYPVIAGRSDLSTFLVFELLATLWPRIEHGVNIAGCRRTAASKERKTHPRTTSTWGFRWPDASSLASCSPPRALASSAAVSRVPPRAATR